MATVEVPSRKRAMVNLAPRPWTRSIAMKTTEPTGRATKASEKMANEYSVPVKGSASGNTSRGNTNTDAMA